MKLRRINSPTEAVLIKRKQQYEQATVDFREEFQAVGQILNEVKRDIIYLSNREPLLRLRDSKELRTAYINQIKALVNLLATLPGVIEQWE